MEGEYDGSILVFMYKNRTRKHLKFILRRERGIKEKHGGVNLRYTESTYVNVTKPHTTIIC
jgi:hypothetical protein